MLRPLPSTLAMVQLHSLNSSQERPAVTKKPGLGCRQKTGVTSSRLARPFSDLFYVAASRPAKSPRGGINAPVGHKSSSACGYVHAEAISDPTRRLFASRHAGFE